VLEADAVGSLGTFRVTFPVAVANYVASLEWRAVGDATFGPIPGTATTVVEPEIETGRPIEGSSLTADLPRGLRAEVVAEPPECTYEIFDGWPNWAKSIVIANALSFSGVIVGCTHTAMLFPADGSSMVPRDISPAVEDATGPDALGRLAFVPAALTGGEDAVFGIGWGNDSGGGLYRFSPSLDASELLYENRSHCGALTAVIDHDALEPGLYYNCWHDLHRSDFAATAEGDFWPTETQIYAPSLAMGSAAVYGPNFVFITSEPLAGNGYTLSRGNAHGSRTIVADYGASGNPTVLASRGSVFGDLVVLLLDGSISVLAPVTGGGTETRPLALLDLPGRLVDGVFQPVTVAITPAMPPGLYLLEAIGYDTPRVIRVFQDLR
jgi:hypothetical protein